jgi:hypothetical protein
VCVCVCDLTISRRNSSSCLRADIFTVKIYPISYHQDGAEVPTADFDDNRALFCKIAREYKGDNVGKFCVTPLKTTRFS